MKTLLLLLLPCAIVLSAWGGPPPDAKTIQGTWLPVKAEIGGVLLKDDFLTNTVLKLDGGKYVVTVAGSPDKGTYKLNADAKPKTLDIAGVEGPNAGQKIPCIYELDGETLRICYGLGGTNRSAEFKSPAGTKYFLVAYHRKKP